MTDKVQKFLQGQRLVAVDPDKRGFAYSIWEGGQFIDAGLYRRDDCSPFWISRKLSDMEPTLLVCEKPRAYPGQAAKGDPNDLIDLSQTVGACLASCNASFTVYPSDWKGQLPKEVHHARLQKHPLWSARAGLCVGLVSAGLRHNVLDAIGIGVWVLDPANGAAMYLACQGLVL